MKICFLVGTLARGGAEKQLIFMLRAAQSAGYGVRVLCLTRGEDHEREIKRLGIKIEWIGQMQNRFVRLSKIIKNLRASPVDIIQSSHFYTNIYAALAGKILQIPSIGAIRSNLTNEISIHGFLGKWQVKLPKFLIANSASAKRRTIEFGIAAENIEFVRNVVEAPESANEYAKDDSTLTILFVGSLTTHKRPEQFIRIAKALLKRFPSSPLRFLIAGDGVLREKLEKMTRELEITESIEFLGVCREMSGIYRRADILISTSAYEGTPNVILEAMAHGLPVIASKVGGVPEILNESRGFLIEPEDKKAFVAAAIKLIRGRNLRHKLGAEGLNYVRENHSLESLTAHLSAIYEKLGQPEKQRRLYPAENFSKLQ